MPIISPTSAVNSLATNSTNELQSPEPKHYPKNEGRLSESRLPTPNKTTDEIDSLLLGEDKGAKPLHCVTLIGYSGMSYEDFDGEMGRIKSQLEECVRDNPDKQVVVVCGGTSVGIGGVYDVVANDAYLKANIKCIGIVSELASEGDLVQNKDDFKVGIVRVPDPNQSWKTKFTDGDQDYQAMLYPAHKFGGEILAFGAGGIGYDEIKAAKDIGIKITVFPSKPHNDLLQAKLNKNNEFRDVCPLLYHEFGIKG
ncbi:hypothetical protein [Pantoea cypripedii]|nr:hypothetical protein [Pantoea cypripedii]MBP2200185.1 hypothetical protein [Pantoea cypripedii]